MIAMDAPFRHIFMPTKTTSMAPRPTGGLTIATSVYDRLRRDIIGGALAPGHKLGSNELRERYKVGISPVREALNRLVAEKLVCFKDQKGFHVAGIGLDDLEDLVRTRCWIEEIALRQSISNADEAWEDGIVVAFHHLSREPRSAAQEGYAFNAEWEERHRAFHMAIFANCGSPRLLAYCDLLADQANRYRQLAAAISYPDRHKSTEHKAIMDAAINRDADGVVKLHLAHLRDTIEIVKRSGMPIPPHQVAP